MQPTADQPFVGKLARSLRQRVGVGEGDRLVVAVSGGADSTALLRGLASLAGRRRWRLTLAVAHVHHHLRVEADAEADFVQRLADQLGLAFYQRDVWPGREQGDATPGSTAPAQAAPRGGSGEGNLEASARRLRYQALGEIAREAGANFVVTAHQADDQLETLLMRLMRGSGVRGLRGIAWRRRLPRASQGDPDDANVGCPRPHLIRPMLGIGRSEAVEFLQSLDQPWCEDPSNRDTARWRARLRAEVVPVLAQMQPDVAQKATRAADHFRALHRMLRREVNAARHRVVQWDPTGQQYLVDRTAARVLPRLTLDTLLRDLLIEAGSPRDRLSRRALRPLAGGVVDGKGGCRRFDLPGGVLAWLDRTTLNIASRPGADPTYPGDE